MISMVTNTMLLYFLNSEVKLGAKQQVGVHNIQIKLEFLYIMVNTKHTVVQLKGI